MKNIIIVGIFCVGLYSIYIWRKNATTNAVVNKNSDGSISYDPNATDAITKLAYKVLATDGLSFIPNHSWNLSYSFDKTMDIINKLDSMGLAALNRVAYNKYTNKWLEDYDILNKSLLSSIPDFQTKYGNNPTQKQFKDYTEKDCIIYANVWIQEAIIGGGIDGNDSAAVSAGYQKVLADIKKELAGTSTGTATATATGDTTSPKQQNIASPSPIIKQPT